MMEFSGVTFPFFFIFFYSFAHLSYVEVGK
jgi:hypothetical protein